MSAFEVKVDTGRTASDINIFMAPKGQIKNRFFTAAAPAAWLCWPRCAAHRHGCKSIGGAF
jgi:hypothetical protein